jgi:phenylpyruvate tautomerase PptA (4-oxalocrotonate tautomerase family)
MLTLANDGAELVSGALFPDDLRLIMPVFMNLHETNAGFRIGVERLVNIRPIESITKMTAVHLGADARPVRAILFDKHKSNNWALGWHQDRTIAVKERRDVEGFGPWTIKGEIHHVAPPIDILSKMMTVRVHLDAVDADNAPLLIAPHSHQRGFIAEGNIESVVKECGQRACLADAGDVWLYATLILHASARAIRPRRRRVLQIDYSADDLPGGLKWAAGA